MTTSANAASKWARNLGNSTSDIQAGVNAVTESPTAAAAAKAAKWQQKVSSQDTLSRFVSGLSGVSLDQWKQAMINKGLQRVAGGATAAVPKFTAFMDKLLPAVQAAQQKVQAMPDLTLADSIARATTFMTEMSKFKAK